jgi:hypothetical protein
LKLLALFYLLIFGHKVEEKQQIMRRGFFIFYIAVLLGPTLAFLNIPANHLTGNCICSKARHNVIFARVRSYSLSMATEDNEDGEKKKGKFIMKEIEGKDNKKVVQM